MGFTNSAVEQALGLANSSFHRWFSRKSELRVKQLLDVLAYLKIEPQVFFDFAFRTAELDAQKMLEAVIRSPLGRKAPADDAEVPDWNDPEIQALVSDLLRQRREANKGT
jgi:hypothetical protein